MCVSILIQCVCSLYKTFVCFSSVMWAFSEFHVNGVELKRCILCVIIRMCALGEFFLLSD